MYIGMYYVCMCMYVCMYVYCICTYACMYVRKHVCKYVYTYVYECNEPRISSSLLKYRRCLPVKKKIRKCLDIVTKATNAHKYIQVSDIVNIVFLLHGY